MADRFNVSKNNYCALPFGHTTVTTNGNFAVCCLHDAPKEFQVNINHHDLTYWVKSDYLQQVRQSFRNNERHPGCKSCWINEDLGQESMRLRTIKEYKILGVSQSTEIPVDFEIQIGNLCNLSCLMCNEKYSSSILAENIKLKINQHTQDDFKWSDTAFENLQKIISSGPKIFNVLGGEPLYNKKFLELLESLSYDSCKNTMLQIVTNGTQWNSRWKEVLKKFKLVRIMFSVDATDDLYEYMRYPGVWKETDSNIADIITGDNIKPLVNCTVQNLNIGSLGSVVQWAEEKNIYLQLCQLLEPTWLSLTNLPRHLKIDTISHLETVLQRNLTDHLRQQITSYHAQLTKSLDQPDDLEAWKTFQTQVGMRESLRNNSHKRFLNY